MAREIKGKNGGTLYAPDKGDTHNPNGRPKKLVSGLIDDLKAKGYERVTRTQIEDAISIMLNTERSELEALSIDKEQPIYVQITAKRLLNAKERDLDALVNSLLDRAHGKATQPVETNSTVTITGAGAITPEQAAEVAKIINGGGGS